MWIRKVVTGKPSIFSSKVSFDPGGTDPESGETTCEVKLCRQVDAPFDPGGFGLKTKFKDEFFFEDEEYTDAVVEAIKWLKKQLFNQRT